MRFNDSTIENHSMILSSLYWHVYEEL